MATETVKVKSTIAHTYMGKSIAAGEEFDAHPADANYLQGTWGLADLIPAPEPEPEEPPPAPPPPPEEPETA